jgi:hypothetical protein
LAGGANTDDGIKPDEHRQRCRRQRDRGKADREQHDARQEHTTHAPAIDQNANQRQGDRDHEARNANRCRERAAIPAELLTHRLQKNAESEEHDRPGADNERKGGTEDDAPGVLEPAFLRHLISPPASRRATRTRRFW